MSVVTHSAWTEIRTDADVAEGALWLADHEPRFAKVMAHCTPLPLRLRPPGFAGLVDIIISQQVSVASAAAIMQRMTQAELLTPEKVKTAGEAGLLSAGLSRPKARYVLGLAQADFDFSALERAADAQAMQMLCALKGIGPWSAEIYVMFCLGRRDIFPAGDLALQEAARALFDLPERPKPEVLAQMAEDWSPWRSVAARALFAYYRILKRREGIA